MSSASALVTFSLTGFGAPSTRSFASLRPSPVSSRTTLITWIFLSPAAERTTSNSVFSSVAAPPPAAAPAAPGMAATATGAAAETPHFSCSSLLSCAASSSVSLSSSSAICSTLAISRCSPLYLPSRARRIRILFRALAALTEHVHELALRRLQQPDELGHRTLQRADDLRANRFLRRQVGEGLEPGGLQHLALHVPSLDDERLVRPRERVQRLGHGNGIVLRNHHPRRALEQALHAREALGQRELREPVLDDLVLGGHRAQLSTQIAQLLNGQPAILCQQHRLHAAQPALEILDALDLFLRRHDLSPP